MIESAFWMDGYGPYVWAAWLIAGLSVKGLLAWTYMIDRSVKKDLAELRNNDHLHAK